MIYLSTSNIKVFLPLQVNGKSYNQARLMLGNMGSLHPANRLAAFVTGRLRPPGGISLKVSRKTHPSKKTATPDSLHTKPAGAVVPAGTTARGAADLKPPGKIVLLFPDLRWRLIVSQKEGKVINSRTPADVPAAPAQHFNHPSKSHNLHECAPNRDRREESSGSSNSEALICQTEM